jgi:hypothetical protein
MRSDELIGLVVGLAAVGLAARYARNREQARAPASTRTARTFHAALVFSIVQLVNYGVFAVSNPGGTSQFLANLIPTLLVFTFGSILLFGLAELILGLFRPERSRSWLTLSIAIFAVAAVGSLAGPVWLAQEQVTLRLPLLLPALSAAAAALVWWAHLPPPERRPGLFG